MSVSLLRRLITFGFGALAFAFLFVLLSSLGERNSPSATATPQGLALGETGKRWFQGQRVWATRLSQNQRRVLGAASPCSQKTFCIIAAAGSQAGIDVVFSQHAPPQWPGPSSWHGGFVDPSNGSLYDLDGRARSPKEAPPLTLIDP